MFFIVFISLLCYNGVNKERKDYLMPTVIDDDGQKYEYRLIVVEGPDGVGKTTFCANLAVRLRQHDHPYIRQHFPCKTCWHSSVNGRDEVLGWNRVSTPVAEYLGGRVNIVGNSRAIAHLYTQDRLLAWHMDGYIQEGEISLRKRVLEMCRRNNESASTTNTPVLLLDRYTQSSMIYQGADMLEDDCDEFCDWLEDYEYEKLYLPRPDNVIYLDAKIEDLIKSIQSRSKLIGVKKDLHEKDNDYLADVCVTGRRLALYRKWETYQTMDKDGKFVNYEQLTKQAYNDIFNGGIYE